MFLDTPTPIEVWTGRRRLAEGATWPPSTSGVADRGDRTMNEHPDVEVVRQMTEALTSGDFETAGTYLADDIVWHEIGRAEPRRGKAELQANMGEVDYEITGTLHAIIGDDEHVVALIDATAAGRPVAGFPKEPARLGRLMGVDDGDEATGFSGQGP
jgi:hypothetical protein